MRSDPYKFGFAVGQFDKQASIPGMIGTGLGALGGAVLGMPGGPVGMMAGSFGGGAAGRMVGNWLGGGSQPATPQPATPQPGSAPRLGGPPTFSGPLASVGRAIHAANSANGNLKQQMPMQRQSGNI